MKTPPAIRFGTYGLLILVALSTLYGLFSLWPDYGKVGEIAERANYTAPGAGQAQGEVLQVTDGCEGLAVDSGADPLELEEQTGELADSALNVCQTLSVGLLSGDDSGRVVDVVVRGNLALAGLAIGDHVELISLPVDLVGGEAAGSTGDSGDSGGTGDSGDSGAEDDAGGTGAEDDAGSAGASETTRYALANTYEVSGVDRNLPIVLLLLVFLIVVIAVGRLRGLFALCALVVAGFVLLGFVLPALVGGGPALLIGLVGASAIMFVTLYFVHGPNLRTTSALIGTLAGILIISGVSWISVRFTKLSGLGDDASGLLSGMVSEIDFRGLLTASILIAGLGVLNDVTITQASSVWELRSAAPELSRREIYQRAMRIGRDHIASTVYTVFFAYAGAAISTLILLYLYDRPVLSLLTQEDIAIEIVRTLAGSIGLVLAVPITTWVAAMFVPSAVQPSSLSSSN